MKLKILNILGDSSTCDVLDKTIFGLKLKEEVIRSRTRLDISVLWAREMVKEKQL